MKEITPENKDSTIKYCVIVIGTMWQILPLMENRYIYDLHQKLLDYLLFESVNYDKCNVIYELIQDEFKRQQNDNKTI